MCASNKDERLWYPCGAIEKKEEEKAQLRRAILVTQEEESLSKGNGTRGLGGINEATSDLRSYLAMTGPARVLKIILFSSIHSKDIN